MPRGSGRLRALKKPRSSLTNSPSTFRCLLFQSMKVEGTLVLTGMGRRMGGAHDCWWSEQVSHMTRGPSLIAVECIYHAKSEHQALLLLLADVFAT